MDTDKNHMNVLMCRFNENETDWLCYHILQTNILPLESKRDAFVHRHYKVPFKQIEKKILCSVHYRSKDFRNSLKLCHQFLPVSKYSNEFIWTNFYQHFI